MKELKEMMYQYNDDYIFKSEKFAKRFPDFKVTSYDDGVKQTVAGGV